jgi:hypothetical protein
VLADIFQQRTGHDSSAHTPLARDSGFQWSTGGGREVAVRGLRYSAGGDADAAATSGLGLGQDRGFSAAGSPRTPDPCMLPRTAPLTSLATQLALYALLSGNARAIALLWRG